MEPEPTPSSEQDAAGGVRVGFEDSPGGGARPPVAGSVLSIYVSPRGLTRLAAAGLVAAALIGWLAVGVDLAHVRQLRLQLSGVAAGATEITAVEAMLLVVRIGKLAVFFLAAVAFAVWLYRLRVNVRAFGVRKLVFARHWSLVGFLVPVLNLVRPYQVMAEVWRASDPSVLDAFEWKSVEPPPLLLRWWASVVAAATLEFAAFGLGLTAEHGTFKALVAAAAALVADAAVALSASLGWFVVMRLCDVQIAKRERLEGEAARS